MNKFEKTKQFGAGGAAIGGVAVGAVGAVIGGVIGGAAGGAVGVVTDLGYFTKGLSILAYRKITTKKSVVVLDSMPGKGIGVTIEQA